MSHDETFIQSLPCRLTQAELVDRSRELAEQLVKRACAENLKKRAAAEAKDAIEKAEQRIHRLGGIIRTGEEPRDVECYYVQDWAEQQITTHRADTGARVTSRPMTAKEKQQRLPLRVVRPESAPDDSIEAEPAFDPETGEILSEQ